MTDDKIARWEQRWQDGQTPWDLGEPHPGLKTLWRRLEPLKRQGHWWVPGCGRGHEAAFLARKGLRVTGADFSPAAVEVANKTYGHLVTFEIADALEKESPQFYDGVVDRAMWCALKPELWKSYLESCRYRLKAGGTLVSLAFGTIVDIEEGPPFSITEDQIRETLTAADFSIEILENHPWAGSGLEFIRDEWWVVARANG